MNSRKLVWTAAGAAVTLSLGLGCAHHEEARAPSPSEVAAAPSPNPSAGASEGVAPVPGSTGRMTLVRPGGSTEAVFRGDQVTGPNMQLAWTESGLRGQAFNRPVQLTWKNEGPQQPTRITGMIGTAPVNLNVEPEQGGWRAQGMFGGRLGQLSFSSATGVEGKVGICSYDLRPSAPLYFEGQSACPRGPRPTSLTLPGELTALTLPEQAAVTAVLLAGR